MIDWDNEIQLGLVPDCVLAKKYNISNTAVMGARTRRGIKPFRTNNHYDINWDSIPLGQYTDLHLANILGCSLNLVHKERNKRKIPPYKMNYRTLENEGAYYHEAIIDMYFHNQKISHKFQKKIGPYRVDWLLDDNLIWEYLGMWDHLIYGQKYRENFLIKENFLISEGYSVKRIYKEEISTFQSSVDLTLLHSLGRFVCLGCLRKEVKHHAHGYCCRCCGRLKDGQLRQNVTTKLKQSDVFVCSVCESSNKNKRVRDLCAKCYRKQQYELSK